MEHPKGLSQPTNEQMQSSPISIGNAASMFRYNLKKNRNERPYTVTARTLNNELVDEWKQKVLTRMANTKGEVMSSTVYHSLTVFLEGKEMLCRQKHVKNLPEISEDMAKYWCDFFRKSDVKEIHSIGTIMCRQGWDVLQTYIKTYYAKLKWDSVYSKSQDPYEWLKLSNEHPILFSHERAVELAPFELTPEDLKDMQDKVFTFLNARIEIDNDKK